MRITFFVNSIDLETPAFATTALALSAVRRGHSVMYVTPGDFILRPDDSLALSAVVVPEGNYKTAEKLFAALLEASRAPKTFEIDEMDVLFLRNDPSLDAVERPWAASAGIMFGRLASERGVLVVNDPGGLAMAQNKLYLQEFPESVRPKTLISRSLTEIRAFVETQQNGCIVKPLQGSGGKGVFRVANVDDSNLNQIFEAASGEGYLIAQAYMAEAKGGDIRLFLLNGRPLERNGAYAAFKRVPAKGDLRSNIHASGTARKAKVSEQILSLAELVRPKLVSDGMFLVGLDIVGDKLLEINVFTPGGLGRASGMYKVDFCEPVILSLEAKVAAKKAYGESMSNARLASL